MFRKPKTHQLFWIIGIDKRENNMQIKQPATFA